MQDDLPIEFVNKMETLLGNDCQKFFEALSKPQIKGIMVNSNKFEIFKELADFKYSPIPKVSFGYKVENFKIGNHILNHLGIIYSQEPSAMYPVEMLDIVEGQIVLDLCSAPGGKAIQILNKLNGTGLLIANEIDYKRAQILYENLVRMGYTNFAITCNSPSDFENLDLKFDRILVDAPCGGEGMIRKNDFDMDSYKKSSILTNANRQTSILNSIANLLKPNGKLVYSTCTYDPAENEQVVATFLENHKNFEILPCEKLSDVTTPGIKIGSYPTDKTYRRYPHLFEGEGQYMACLINKDLETYEQANLNGFKANGYTLLGRKDIENLIRLLKNTVDLSNFKLAKRNDNIYVLPDTVCNFGNLNVVTIGVLLGTTSYKDFKIAHNFYHCLGQRVKNQISLNLTDTQKYILGYEIDNLNSSDGICTVNYHNVPLGGGKVVCGKLKNYYPKNLRN